LINLKSICLFHVYTVQSARDDAAQQCEEDESSSVRKFNVSSPGVVMISIGGGHYVPKMNDAVRTKDWRAAVVV
jgi:D-tyrosyl-tRNA(Tyr) deacylase